MSKNKTSVASEAAVGTSEPRSLRGPKSSRKSNVFRLGRDMMRVVPDCSPDLTKAIENNVILDKDIPSMYNKIDSTADIGGKISDVFDVYDYQNKFTRTKGARSDDKD